MYGIILLCLIALAVWTVVLANKVSSLEKKNKNLEDWVKYFNKNQPTVNPLQTTLPQANTPVQPSIPNPDVVAVPPPPPPPVIQEQIPHYQKPLEQPVLTAPKKPLTSERLLAIGGGIFVLLGVVFLLLMAFREGWISPAMRVWLAILGGTCAVVVGALLGERHGRTPGLAFGDPAGVTVGVGIGSALLGTLLGVFRYDMFSPEISFFLTILFGAVAVFIADRWRSQDLAAFGFILAFAAPMLDWGNFSLMQLGLIGLLIAAAGVINVRRGWGWLNYLALLITFPQLMFWIFDKDWLIDLTHVYAFAGYWVLLFATTIGYQLRHTNLRRSVAAHLLTLTSLMFISGHVLIDNLVSKTNSVINGNYCSNTTCVDPTLHKDVLLWNIDKSDAFAIFSLSVAAIYLLIGFALKLLKGGRMPLVTFIWALSSYMLLVGTAEALDNGPVLLLALSLQAVLLSLLYIKIPSKLFALSAALHALAACVVFMSQDFAEIIFDTAKDFQTDPIMIALYPTFALGLLWGILKLHPSFNHRLLAKISASGFLIASLASVSALSIQLLTMQSNVSDANLINSDYRAQTILALIWALIAAPLLIHSRRLENLWNMEFRIAVAGSLAAFGVILGLLLFPPAYTSIYLLVAAISLVGLAVLLFKMDRENRYLSALAVFWREIMLAWILFAAAPFWDGFSIGFDKPLWPMLYWATWLFVIWPLVAQAKQNTQEADDPEAFPRQSYDIIIWVLSLFIASSSLVTSIFGNGETLQESAQAALTIWWVLLGFILYLLSFNQQVIAKLQEVTRIEKGMIIRNLALLLLAVSAGKLVFLDMQQLEAISRVLAFIGSGMLLLLASWLGQRFDSSRDETN